ncbi:MAG: hypothetical protein QM817_41870 [Archangium sp.]
MSSRSVVATVLLTALSAFAAPPNVQRDAEVRCVLLAPGDGGPSALVSRVRARIVRNRSGAPSVGILSGSASVPDDQWSTTLWQAAFVASEATNSSLVDFEFTLQVVDPVRDRSAGMSIATTLVALINGKKLLPNTVIVGAINPDGSAGPVEDAPLRIRAAAADGVKRLGVPLGARTTDVVLEADRLGLEVKELAGLEDAYAFLTGDTLARPAPATDANMELWPAELKGLSRLTTQVRAELDTELPAAVDGGSPLRARIDRATQQAADFERNGDTVRAFVVWSSALTLVRALAQDAQLQRLLAEKDDVAVLASVQKQQEAFTTERAELRRQIDTRFAHTSRANDMYAMDVLESIVTQGSATRAAEAVKSLQTGEPDFAQRARELAEALLRGREDLRNGQRFVELYASLPVLKKKLPPLDAARLANSYAAAARGAVVPNIKRDATSAELRGYEALLRTETDERAKLLLAARQNIYSAHLANVYGALGGQLNEKGVLSIRNSRALASQLELARARVLQTCGRAAREASMVPFAARLRYLNARAAREGSDGQKAEALADLWVANWWCEVAR